MAIHFSQKAPPAAPAEERGYADILRLAGAQLHCALQDANPDVEGLSAAVTQLHILVSRLGAPDDSATRQAMSQELAQAVLAIQFYDRLVQRLGHVRHSLDLLEEVLRAPHASATGQRSLLSAIQATYTMEDEKRVFDVVMQGGGAEEALTALRAKAPKASDDDGIELF